MDTVAAGTPEVEVEATAEALAVEASSAGGAVAASSVVVGAAASVPLVLAAGSVPLVLELDLVASVRALGLGPQVAAGSVHAPVVPAVDSLLDPAAVHTRRWRRKRRLRASASSTSRTPGITIRTVTRTGTTVVLEAGAGTDRGSRSSVSGRGGLHGGGRILVCGPPISSTAAS